MRKFKITLIVFTFLYVLVLATYFTIMYLEGKVGVSVNSQDWGGLGSYIGGIFTPIAALLSGYFVYVSFAANAHQQKLQLIRETLARLDSQLEKQFEAPFKNGRLGEQYHGVPFRDVLYAISNNEIKADNDTKVGILALLHNVAILTNSIRYYTGLLADLPSDRRDTEWLGDLERGYWIQKYSPISTRMVKIVGEEAFKSKTTKEELKSFNFVFGCEYDL
nr:hypothetical protein [Gayadomonas joobiniege]